MSVNPSKAKSGTSFVNIQRDLGLATIVEFGRVYPGWCAYWRRFRSSKSNFLLPLNFQLFGSCKLCHRENARRQEKRLPPKSRSNKHKSQAPVRLSRLSRLPTLATPTASHSGDSPFAASLSFLGNGSAVRCPHHSFTSF